MSRILINCSNNDIYMSSLSLLFARRYLFSKKSHSVINIISAVSSFAVGIPVAAMVILLSVFNGFEGVVKQMYKAFDPDIAVTAYQGKFFERNSIDIEALKQIEGVENLSFVLDENGLLEYRKRQTIGIIRGIDSLFDQVVPIRDMVVKGEYAPMFGDIEQALVGQGVAYNIGVNTALYDPVRIYSPSRKSFSSLLPVGSYRTEQILPSGIFALDLETDSQYIIVPLSFAERLFDYQGKASSLAIKTTPESNPDRVRAAVSAKLGDSYKVLTRYQQKESLYKIMTYEKWGIFFIIALVMVIASFSIVGSLVMLIIDKRKDIRTVITIGATVGFVRSIFVKEGMLISTIGAVCGLLFGLGFCLLQQWLGLIKIPARTFMMDSYPIVIKAGDLIGIVLLFTVVNYIIARFTVIKMIPKTDIRL